MLLSCFQLTSLLTDVLKCSAPSRVVYLMNLDYRNGEIRFDDINCTEKYNQSEAFYQSQLANMMAVKSFSEQLKDSKVTVNAAYPGKFCPQPAFIMPSFECFLIMYHFNRGLLYKYKTSHGH